MDIKDSVGDGQPNLKLEIEKVVDTVEDIIIPTRDVNSVGIEAEVEENVGNEQTPVLSKVDELEDSTVEVEDNPEEIKFKVDEEGNCQQGTVDASEGSDDEKSEGDSDSDTSVVLGTVDPTEFSDDNEDGIKPGQPLKTKNEILEEEALDVEDLPKFIPENQKIYKLGTIFSHIKPNKIVIQADSSNLNLDKMKVIDTQSLICLENRKVIGKVFDTFGPVKKPFYLVRFSCGSGIPLEPQTREKSNCTIDLLKLTLVETEQKVKENVDEIEIENEVITEELDQPQVADEVNEKSNTPNITTPLTSPNPTLTQVEVKPNDIYTPQILKDINQLESLTSEIFQQFAIGLPVYYTSTTPLKSLSDLLKAQPKGSDASNFYDEPINDSDQEFTDDEKELLAKKNNKRKKGTNIEEEDMTEGKNNGRRRGNNNNSRGRGFKNNNISTYRNQVCLDEPKIDNNEDGEDIFERALKSYHDL